MPHNSLVLKMHAQVEGAGRAYPKAAALGPGIQGCVGHFPPVLPGEADDRTAQTTEFATTTVGPGRTRYFKGHKGS